MTGGYVQPFTSRRGIMPVHLWPNVRKHSDGAGAAPLVPQAAYGRFFTGAFGDASQYTANGSLSILASGGELQVSGGAASFAADYVNVTSEDFTMCPEKWTMYVKYKVASGPNPNLCGIGLMPDVSEGMVGNYGFLNHNNGTMSIITGERDELNSCGRRADSSGGVTVALNDIIEQTFVVDGRDITYTCTNLTTPDTEILTYTMSNTELQGPIGGSITSWDHRASYGRPAFISLIGQQNIQEHYVNIDDLFPVDWLILSDSIPVLWDTTDPVERLRVTHGLRAAVWAGGGGGSLHAKRIADASGVITSDKVSNVICAIGANDTSAGEATVESRMQSLHDALTGRGFNVRWTKMTPLNSFDSRLVHDKALALDASAIDLFTPFVDATPPNLDAAFAWPAVPHIGTDAGMQGWADTINDEK